MPIPCKKMQESKLSAKERIYRTLKQWIIDGTLLENEKLVDSEIAVYFGTSRTPVREALQMLDTQKLVITVPGKTTVVAPLERENIRKWYELIAYLECCCAVTASRYMTEEQEKQLRLLSAAFAQKVSRWEAGEKDSASLLEADIAFHQFLVEVAENDMARQFVETMRTHILRIEYRYFSISGSLHQSMEEHEKLITYLAQGDEEKIRQLVLRHWDKSIAELEEHYEC